jgi:hypothetical protein
MLRHDQIAIGQILVVHGKNSAVERPTIVNGANALAVALIEPGAAEEQVAAGPAALAIATAFCQTPRHIIFAKMTEEETTQFTP